MNLYVSLSRYCTAIFVHRRWIVAVSVLLAIIVGAGALRLESTPNNRVFFGANNPELAAFQNLEATYSEANQVLIAIAAADGDMFTPERLAILAEVTESLWRIPFSTRVDSIANFQYSRADGDDLIISDLIPPGRQPTADEAEAIRRIALAEPLLTGLLISHDGRTAGINVNFRLPEDIPAAIPEIVDSIRAITDQLTADSPDLQAYLTGNVMIMSAFGEASERDLTTLIPVMFVAITAVLLLLIPTVMGVALALLLGLLSNAVAMGFAGWTGVVLNAGPSPAPLIILTLALAYSVHMLTRFLDEYATGSSKREAITETIQSNLVPVGLTSLTTVIGFLSMNASDAPPFHDLGTIVAVGVLAAFVFSFTLFPAALAILPIRQPKLKARDAPFVRRYSRFVIGNRHAIFFTMLILIAATATGITRIQLNDDWVRYFDDRFQFRQDTEFVLENLTGIDVLEYSIPATGENGIFAPTYLTRLDRFVDWLREQPDIVNVVSIVDILKRINSNLHGDDPDAFRVPADMASAAQYLLLYELSLPRGLDLTDRVSVDRSASRVTITARKNGTNLQSRELRGLAERIDGWLTANGAAEGEVQASGLSLMFSHMSERNIRTMLVGTGLALLLISGVLIFALRSAALGIASLIPNFVPAVLAFGLWGIIVGEIGVAVSVVAAMTFGIVVDDTIHFLTKYARGRRELGKSPEESIEYAFRSVGRALVVTTIVLATGFVVLATSGFRVNSDMGLLTAITLVLALAADFLFLPTVLLAFDRDRRVVADGAVALARLPKFVELEPLKFRVTKYLERIKNGHPLKGKPIPKDAIELWSNDYLCLSGHPKIVEAQLGVLRASEDDIYMSAAFLTENSYQRMVEGKLASFVRAEDAVLCQSGWCANVGLIQTLADKMTPVYIDIYAHASLWEGASSANAPTHPFAHNDVDSLAAQIKRHGPGVIVVDAIYSGDGSICPLREVAGIATRTGSILVVDESHSVGTYGPEGRGMVAALGLADAVHYRSFSLSKAFAIRAGVVTGSSRVMDFFRYESRPAIFSSAVLPHEVAGLETTLEVIREADDRRRQLFRNAAFLRESLARLGYNVESSESQIIALEAGPEWRTMQLRDALESQGIFGAVFCAPATPKNRSLIRFSVNTSLSEQQLQRIVEVCASIRKGVSLDQWPSTLRKARRRGARTPDQVFGLAESAAGAN